MWEAEPYFTNSFSIHAALRGIIGSSSGMFATTASVVNRTEAMGAAFCSADLVTFAGVHDTGGDHVDVLFRKHVEADAFFARLHSHRRRFRQSAVHGD